MSHTAAIFEAITAGDLESTKRILDEDPGAIRSCNEAGVQPLMFSLYNKQEGIARVIRSRLDDIDILEAAALGELTCVTECLAEDPARVAAVSPDGFTPLHYACFFQQPAVAVLLIELGADVNAVTANPARLRPIHSAAASRSAELVRLLLEGGADPNTQQVGGWTPLHAAALHNHREMLETLLAHGADPGIQSDDGQTAADLARSKHATEALELLSIG